MLRAAVFIELASSDSVLLVNKNIFERNSALIGANAVEVRKREDNALSSATKCMGGVKLVDNAFTENVGCHNEKVHGAILL